jgi:hypothetical protein
MAAAEKWEKAQRKASDCIAKIEQDSGGKK